MPIYELQTEGLRAVSATTFDAERIYERGHIQALLRNSIEVLGEPLMVLAEEFRDWLDSKLRIDLLCLDTNANLVVIELKRTEDGGQMELQALRYAAMVSVMTFDQTVETLARHRNRAQPDLESSRAEILDFLKWDGPQENSFARDTRMILASADFGKELTTTVTWLNDRGLDIRCVRLKPYKLEDGTILLDIHQIIPPPETQSFQTQIGVKRQAERKEHVERHELRLQFWSALLERARKRTQLHANRSPTESNWLSVNAGRPGYSLTYVIRQQDCNVEFWIALGPGARAQNKAAFAALQAHTAEIEETFGATLVWDEMPERDASRIRFDVPGGYRSSIDEWEKVQDTLIEKMIRLDAALRQHIHDLTF